MEIIDQPDPASEGVVPPQKLLDRGYEFSIGDAITEGFELFKQKLGEFVAYALIVTVALAIASSVLPFVSALFGPVFGAGFYIMAHRIKRRESTNFEVFFKGFSEIGPLLLYGLVSSILIVVGLFLLLIPGLYLAVGYSIAVPFIVFYRFQFWDAMEWSRKVVTKQWFKFFGFAIVLVLINMAGAIAFGIGILFTIPITYCSIYAAFDKITGASGGEIPAGSSNPNPEPSGDTFTRSGYQK